MSTSLPLPQQTDDLRKVYVEITTDCNLDCGMCIRHVWQRPVGNMAEETFRALIGQLRAIPSVSTLSFGGFGEPTVHPRFLDFLSEVKKAGIRAELVTNGLSLTGEFAERLLDLELDRLVVSLDGVASDQDQAFHGDCSAVVQGNLRAFHQLGQSRRVPLPDVHVQFVATRNNIHELPTLASRSRQLGVSKIVATNLIPYSPDLADMILYRRWATPRRNTGGSPGNPTISLPRLDAKSEATGAIETLFLQGRHVQLGNSDLNGGMMRCQFVADGCLAIAPNGDVSPCLPLMHSHAYYYQEQRRDIREYRLGNLTDTSLHELWNADEYRGFREKVHRFDFSPCIDCGGCDLRESNEEDCSGNEFPCCGACLWATGLIQCP